MLNLSHKAISDTIDNLWICIEHKKAMSSSQYDLKQQIANLEEDVTRYRYGIEFDVLSETENISPLKATEKPKYSNVEKRKLEVERRMTQDNGIQTKRSEIADLQRRQYDCQQAVWRAKDEYGILLVTVQAQIGMLSAYQAPVTREMLDGKVSDNG